MATARVTVWGQSTWRALQARHHWRLSSHNRDVDRSSTWPGARGRRAARALTDDVGGKPASHAEKIHASNLSRLRNIGIIAHIDAGKVREARVRMDGDSHDGGDGAGQLCIQAQSSTLLP